MSDLTEEQRTVAEKVAKLLETRGSTEAEAQAKIAKAMELLERHNLTMDAVEREKDGGGRRADEKLRGGFYQYERDLWGAVAELNFCLYLRWWDYEEVQVKTRYGFMTRDRKVYQHRVIGRQVNIAATKAMASYLMDVTQRLTRERLEGRLPPGASRNTVNSQMLGAWAISFREGIVDRLVEKLAARRRLQLKKELEEARAARKMAAEGASLETGLTLASLTESEADANADLLMGEEGWSAKQRAKRAEAQAKAAMFRRMTDQEYTQWAAENPEEAKAEAAKARAARRLHTRSSKGSEPRQKDWGGYRAGYAAGENISVDMQTERTKTAGLL